MSEGAVGFLNNLGGVDVDASLVAVSIGLHISLVEQGVERLGARKVAAVEENLVPETCVEQVENGMLDTTDVQVDAARGGVFARAHPVLLIFGRRNLVVVRGIGVADFVPRRSGPLRHDIHFATVALHAVAKIKLDPCPVLRARERGLRLGVGVFRVECLGGEVVEFGQLHGKLIERERDRDFGCVFRVHDREGLAPVALAAEKPVTQPVRRLCVAEALLLGEFGRGSDRLVLAHAVEVELVAARIDLLPVARVGLSLFEIGGRLNGADHGELESARERVVTFVFGGNGHDGARAVAHEHVVGGEHGKRTAVHRVHGEKAREHSRLLSRIGGALGVIECGGTFLVGGDGLARARCSAGPGGLRVFGPRLGESADVRQQRMLGREHREGRAKQRVHARREDVERGVGEGGAAVGIQRERDLRTARTADPVPLHGFDRFGPVNGVEILEKSIGIRGDAQVPLAQAALEHGEIAALRAALGRHLFVREHGAETRAPVHGRVAHVGESEAVDELRHLLGRVLNEEVERCVVLGIPMLVIRLAVVPHLRDVDALLLGERVRINIAILDRALEFRNGPCRAACAVSLHEVRVVPRVEQLEEYPLGPLDEVKIGRAKRAARVVREAEAEELTGHVRNVFVGRDARVGAGLNRVLLRGQAEGVVAHRVEHILAEHAVVTRDGVGRNVAKRVAHMQSLARGVGEHVHDEHLLAELFGAASIGELAHGVDGVESTLLEPQLLPFLLDLSREFGGVTVWGLSHRVPFLVSVSCALGLERAFNVSSLRAVPLGAS